MKEYRTLLWLGGLVVLVLFLNGFLVPDYSFDIINYHLFNGYRGLKFLSPFNFRNEFYPTGIHTFPVLLDIIYTVSRLIFGYRLGTFLDVVFYFLLIWLVNLVLTNIFRLQKNIWLGLLVVSIGRFDEE